MHKTKLSALVKVMSDKLKNQIHSTAVFTAPEDGIYTITGLEIKLLKGESITYSIIKEKKEE